MHTSYVSKRTFPRSHERSRAEGAASPPGPPALLCPRDAPPAQPSPAPPAPEPGELPYFLVSLLKSPKAAGAEGVTVGAASCASSGAASPPCSLYVSPLPDMVVPVVPPVPVPPPLPARPAKVAVAAPPALPARRCPGSAAVTRRGAGRPGPDVRPEPRGRGQR